MNASAKSGMRTFIDILWSVRPGTRQNGFGDGSSSRRIDDLDNRPFKGRGSYGARRVVRMLRGERLVGIDRRHRAPKRTQTITAAPISTSPTAIRGQSDLRRCGI